MCVCVCVCVCCAGQVTDVAVEDEALGQQQSLTRDLLAALDEELAAKVDVRLVDEQELERKPTAHDSKGASKIVTQCTLLTKAETGGTGARQRREVAELRFVLPSHDDPQTCKRTIKDVLASLKREVDWLQRLRKRRDASLTSQPMGT